MGLFSIIESFNNIELFGNLIILITCIYFFSKLKIRLNTLFAIIVAVSIILYFVEKKKITQQTDDNLLDIKKKTIKPELKSAYNSQDIIDYIMSP